MPAALEFVMFTLCFRLVDSAALKWATVHDAYLFYVILSEKRVVYFEEKKKSAIYFDWEDGIGDTVKFVTVRLSVLIE